MSRRSAASVSATPIDCHGIVRTKIGSHFAPKIGHRTQNWQGIDRMQVADLLVWVRSSRFGLTWGNGAWMECCSQV